MIALREVNLRDMREILLGFAGQQRGLMESRVLNFRWKDDDLYIFLACSCPFDVLFIHNWSTNKSMAVLGFRSLFVEEDNLNFPFLALHDHFHFSFFDRFRFPLKMFPLTLFMVSIFSNFIDLHIV